MCVHWLAAASIVSVVMPIPLQHDGVRPKRADGKEQQNKEVDDLIVASVIHQSIPKIHLGRRHGRRRGELRLGRALRPVEDAAELGGEVRLECIVVGLLLGCVFVVDGG